MWIAVRPEAQTVVAGEGLVYHRQQHGDSSPPRLLAPLLGSEPRELGGHISVSRSQRKRPLQQPERLVPGCANRLFQFSQFVLHVDRFQRAPVEIKGLKKTIWAATFAYLGASVSARSKSPTASCLLTEMKVAQ
jgi:hypothetical protein